ncbi:hypothetical protein pEaSNUABM50_00414 [Erwinia phage pEa_SNUABM_50]|uniref:Uncharacterized protein n=4 Tax=Eneladusvirus BF TaxID=2560751 RepID=A0A7L8ZN55_9CAUD|nr:hypothetical protein FDH34_gp507 [Serratia phage BF]QOI71352.1 hypothetical protein pEaSNUABM12_00420 [Erwinia phage pEa_SNUABM_12]QOI71894.1 hypothetical protein pEaSNUABM47_00416 [Erwinia phage pEa_SNUABM_47]QOI72433.1 hypothetical protein pEaSNUABM50_00414 [Erwinia phage pEa_SNUABM_50]QXO11560.1 hypothetical protein pEaSNUABM19_00420 [Erwinia phage pEa_SNUABM_19]QXO12108.1 hypothetical protein pEaSNUABM44_00418 [Erwinia phage pEa_SNUABM_44]QXO12661.1 hypothetical protein pEaSNUABM49_004
MNPSKCKVHTSMSDETKARLKEMINPKSNVVFVNFNCK